MLTIDDLRRIILAFPETEETRSWGAVSFKVNNKAILFWNPTHDCPVFKVPFEERDHLIEMEPETFFTTDHHRPHALVVRVRTVSMSNGSKPTSPGPGASRRRRRWSRPLMRQPRLPSGEKVACNAG